ncbi:CotH kinase family protein [Neiella marina]|uniref:CotH kinase family protein n=1 Tax=Neiella holothuriorum TaxID=2870530 RepID=A0ABS7EC31_9GAMM|nr:CotH kinase family protein [Neiella holothuriorum]MBW8189891.1 CotH kinase family protein [Neiella holothuriorum]
MRKETKEFVVIFFSWLALLSCGGSGSSDTDYSEEPSDDTPETSVSIVVNEVVADPADGGNDWIEIYAVEGPIDLSDYSLVDDNADRDPQSLPDVILATGEFIVIEAIDEDDVDSVDGYYVTFKLGSDDAVSLLDSNGDTVSELDWDDGDAPEGYSYGLTTDGGDNADTLTPTPGAANEQTSDPVSTIPDDLLTNHDAPVRLNEVVAKDADGGEDWFELYVVAGPVDLSDYSITDETDTLVDLPDVTLTTGQYYRIYATDEALSEVDTVAFKLGASDSLRLYQGDDLVDELSWSKGDALIGASFGRYPDGSDATFTLAPTLEATNIKASLDGLMISEVVANADDSGDDWFELINLSSANIDLSDYQVIDDSEDDEPSDLPAITLAPGDYVVIYATDSEISADSVPFKLGNSDSLSLLLDDETVDYLAWDASDVVEGFSYGLVSTDSSDANLLYPTWEAANEQATAFDPSVVRSIYIDIDDDDWDDILDNPEDEEYHPADLSFDGISLEDVAIRTKGNSSLSAVARSTSDRYSFKIDINEYVDGQKFFGLKKFVLNNSYNDPSYMREAIAYDLLREMGVDAPEYSYVNLYINDELFGFYLMVEVIDGEFVEKHFDNENGDLYKPDGTGSDLVWIDDDISSYSEINLQSNEDSSDQGAFIDFVSDLDNADLATTDVDSVLRYLAVSVSLSNLDSYQGSLAHNYYIYESDGVFSFLPWDLNESFGTFSMGCGNEDIRELYIDEPTSGDLEDRPLIAHIVANDSYLAQYHSYLWELIDGPLADSDFASRVDLLADLIREHVENDPSGFYGADAFELNLTSTSYGFYGLTSFMSYRIDNMTEQLQGTAPSSGNGNGYCD